MLWSSPAGREPGVGRLKWLVGVYHGSARECKKRRQLLGTIFKFRRAAESSERTDLS